MYLYGFSSVFQGGKSFPFPSDRLRDVSVWGEFKNIEVLTSNSRMDQNAK